MTGKNSVYGTPRPANVPTFPLGACVGKAKLMNPRPDNPAAVLHARQVCWGCPVLTDCRAWMSTLTPRTDPGDVLAGTTHAERTGKDPDRRVCRACWLVRPRDKFSLAGKHGQRAVCKSCVAASRPTGSPTSQRAEEAA
ncbi:WhiB family transcriptional regulator [Planotetraspora sp. A-T 1434]|uniref:WhiB family transcriptional regulator n=1 Tax=Planotetraspora sp. A-T 1434 TaxID=2979219 RepID=UPI0021C0968B|nr:WhiB family transcriptional regulator [Planotetraspora sp. A-T 1434]MCT9932413.1 WhiB family transcriptional regulator [Planotetraspora sp. A-T 1434]